MPTGFLVIDKKVGIRSTMCVEAVRRVFRGTKSGHGGTLDSSASGVLVILLGGATRLSGLVNQMPKSYLVRVALGSETSTCDATGEVTIRRKWRHANLAAIESALPGFIGVRMQTPPAISAVHIKGRRAHEIARSGEEPRIEPRPVFIESMKIVSPLSEDGEFSLSVRCGKGTYIRSVARDLGRALGSAAHVVSLRRESVGPFAAEFAPQMGEDTRFSVDELMRAVWPVATMERFLPSYHLKDSDMAKLAAGIGVRAGVRDRVSVGENSPNGVAMACSPDMCSICGIESHDGGIRLIPQINIRMEAHEA